MVACRAALPRMGDPPLPQMAQSYHPRPPPIFNTLLGGILLRNDSVPHHWTSGMWGDVVTSPADYVKTLTMLTPNRFPRAEVVH